MVREDILRKLTRWVGHCENRRGVLAINGLVKTGKTTLLRRLLPQIIRNQFPDVEICGLTIGAFLQRGSDPDKMKHRLRAEVAAWAESKRLPSAAKTLDGLVDELQNSGRRIFFLIDEVQRFFEVKEGKTPDWDALKTFMCVSSQSKLHLVVTGAMVFSWQNFLKMSPKGVAFDGEYVSVFLPTKNEDVEVHYARDRFVEEGGQEVAELLEGITSVPLMAHTFFVWRNGYSIAETREHVTTKLMNEFSLEMTPLLQDPTWANEERLRDVYELAWGKAPKSSSFLKDRLFQRFFREYIIETGSDTYGFVESPWTTCLRHCVSQGKVNDRYSQPILQMFLNEQIWKELATVGELVSGTLRRERLDLTGWSTRKAVERICREHERLHGWPQEKDRSFQQLLGWSNDGVRNSIQQYGYRMRGCTYLEMLRSAYSHRGRDSMSLADYETLLMQCLPPRPSLLLDALKNFTVRHFGGENRLTNREHSFGYQDSKPM